MKLKLIWAAAVIVVSLGLAWVASNTEWTEMKVPLPPTGEARVNPFYAAQRFAERLGARATWQRSVSLPPDATVVVLSNWNWSLGSRRRETLQQWVEGGGRLVVDAALDDPSVEFEEWSGIVRDYVEHEDDRAVEPDPSLVCRDFREEGEERARPGSSNPDVRHSVCDVEPDSFLSTTARASWSIRDESGVQAARVQVGRGSVTVINATPFTRRAIFRGDHSWLFVAATELRRTDHLLFISENDHPSLLALAWDLGAPVMVLAFGAIGLIIWRAAVRLGPLAPPVSTARRSLAEQIRGTGQFLARQGDAEALHGACVRALDEAAEKRIKSYPRAAARDRFAMLAALTGFDANALAAAVHHQQTRRAHELRRTLAFLESARRIILTAERRSSHGSE